MLTNASQIFDFLERHPVCSIERHEIAQSDFGALRRSLRKIVVRFSECGDVEAQEISDRLRAFLSEWLTVPVPFDNCILEAVQTLGDPNAVGNKWGQDIRGLYEQALQSAWALLLAESPVRTKVHSIISGLMAQGQTFRIYCHRRGRAHYQSLFAQANAPVWEATFLHSLRDYREAELFDVLVKVGPLRSRGWGSAPDALICAPRFGTLLQIVWSGCRDEPGFGYDPVATTREDASALADGTVAANDVLGHRISWTPTITRSGRDFDMRDGRETDSDEFQIFGQLIHTRQNRTATLIEIDGGQGILYPPRSEVLSFDPTPDVQEPIQHRHAGETLVQGMFVIAPLHTEADMGGLEAKKGIYSEAWKSRLAAVYQTDPDALVAQLRSNGIDLCDLHASVERWSGSLDDILPAPGKTKHFQILIEALGVDWGANISAETQGTDCWKRAWNEIRHARGEAIQIGRNEQELVDEELLSIVKGLVSDMRSLSATNDTYVLPIPIGRGLGGILRFYKVCSVEEGFLAPETELRLVRELSTIEQWRV